MRRVLLTGFEPFGGDSLNPSWEVARALDGAVVGDATVQALCLPCVFGGANAVLREAIEASPFDLVLALGLAANRVELSLERVALNVDDARIPDNAGRQPVDTPVVFGGPAAYFSRLPIKRMVAALREAGLPAAVSQTAGTFVCNHVFYGLLHLGVPRAGFMHVPPLAVLPLAQQVGGVRLALETALAHPDDQALAGGAIA